MRDFKDIFKTPEWSFVNAFSVCMTVPVSRDQGNGGEGGGELDREIKFNMPLAKF